MQHGMSTSESSSSVQQQLKNIHVLKEENPRDSSVALFTVFEVAKGKPYRHTTKKSCRREHQIIQSLQYCCEHFQQLHSYLISYGLRIVCLRIVFPRVFPALTRVVGDMLG
jgi:hypothetical protein